MKNELRQKIWSHKEFHKEKQQLTLSSLRYSLGISDKLDNQIQNLASQISRLMECACLFSISSNSEHRKAAYEIAVAAWNLFGFNEQHNFFDQSFLCNSISTILSRLGNFPAENYFWQNVGEDKSRAIPAQLWFERENHLMQNIVRLGDHPPLALTDFQRSLWNSLVSQNVIVVSAPTSAGKSFALQNYLAYLFINKAVQSAVYLVPTRALISQVTKDTSHVFSQLKCKVAITEVPADLTPVDDTAVLYVLTQERLQILIDQYDPTIDFIAIDEAQSIAEPSRGVVLQTVIERIMLKEQPGKLMFGAPFAGNPNVFLETFGIAIDNASVMDTSDSPVAQNLIHVATSMTYPSKISLSLIMQDEIKESFANIDLYTELVGDNRTLANIAYRFGKGSQSIVYGSEPVQCEKIGLMLADLCTLEKHNDIHENQALKEFADLIRQYIHRDFSLSHMIEKGIAFHYGNLPSFVRKGIQKLLSSADLSFVVCTSTLLQGINLPAKNVFVLKPTKGRSNGIGIPISSTEFWNLVGRAGRLTKDFEGNIFLIDIDQWRENPFSGPKRQPINPSFRAHLCDRTSELIDFICKKDHPSGVQLNAGFENSFMKLFNDYRSGRLNKTLEQHQKYISSDISLQITSLMNEVSEDIDVPTEITESNPNISVYRQQEMLNYLMSKIESDGPDVLIPPHPLQSNRDTYTMYLRLFKRIHNYFEKKRASDRSHTYFASLALSWMRGNSYAELLKKRVVLKM